MPGRQAPGPRARLSKPATAARLSRDSCAPSGTPGTPTTPAHSVRAETRRQPQPRPARVPPEVSLARLTATASHRGLRPLVVTRWLERKGSDLTPYAPASRTSRL